MDHWQLDHTLLKYSIISTETPTLTISVDDMELDVGESSECLHDEFSKKRHSMQIFSKVGDTLPIRSHVFVQLGEHP